MKMDNYIYSYYQAIKDGSVTVGKWVRIWYEKIVAGIDSGLYTYSPKRANAAVQFIEAYTHHHEGTLAPGRLKLELWQKATVAVIFGILDQEGNRQFREAVIVEGRKNGKTLLAAGIAEYMTFLDDYGARIFFAAPKLDQAALCFDAYWQSIQHEPELLAMANKRRTDVYIPENNGSARPLAFSAKKSDGLNPSLVVCDEIAAWPGEAGLKFYEVIKSALGARHQPLILNITTSGYEDEGIYDELIKRSTRFLLGDSKETRLAPFLYMIDDITKWDDINELQKSNPNLGVSTTVDYLLEEIAIAEGSLSKKAEFITKYCNIKQNSACAWLPAEAVEKASGETLNLEDFRGSYCVGGIDLSRTTDLTAACVVIQKNGKLFVFSKFFLPAEKIQEATARDGLPYDLYIQQGLLQASGDNFVDYTDTFNWFRELVEKYEILPLQVGYDRYSAQYLIKEMEAYGFHMDDCFQGYNMTPAIRTTEGMIRDGDIKIGDNSLLKVHLLDAALKMDAQTDRCKLVKVRNNAHIDGTAALLDAMVVRDKWWAEIGEQLKNEVGK